MKASLGGTNILEPLKWVFSQPPLKGHPRQLFLLTDGAVGNTEQVISLVQKNSSTTRCFTFGIGSGASTALIKGVARAGKGTAEFVNSEEDRLQTKVIKTLKRALQPVISDVSIAWDLAQGWTVQQIPSSLPPLFSGDRLVVYGLLKPSKNVSQVGQNEVRLQGTSGKDEKMEHLITFPSPSTAQGAYSDPHSSDFLHCLAAKTFIQMEQEDLPNKYGAELEEAKSPIISISKSANVVSKLTSFVAVDINNHQPVSGPLTKQVVPSFTGFDRRYYSNFRPRSRKRRSLVSFGQASPSCITKRRCHQEQASPRGRMYDDIIIEYADHAFDAGEEWYGAELNTAPVSASQQKKEGSAVLSLISLQKASGAWEFTDQLVSLCSTGKDALITGCPTEIAVSTKEGKLLWATALALVLLMYKYLDQKDEWEMIAEKGKKWLKEQLPGAVKYDTVLQSAAAAMGIHI